MFLTSLKIGNVSKYELQTCGGPSMPGRCSKGVHLCLCFRHRAVDVPVLLWILGSKRLSLAHVLVATSQELPGPNDSLRQPRGEQKKSTWDIYHRKIARNDSPGFNHYPTIVRGKTSWRNVWTSIHSLRGAISRWFVSATEGLTAILVGQMPKFAITGQTEADFWLCIGHDATLMSHCLMLRP